MDNNMISLDAMIQLAVTELDNIAYEDYIQKKNRNKLDYPGDELNNNIEKIIIKEERKEQRKIFTKRFSKSAVCFALIFSFMSCTFLTAEAVRESVVTVAVEWYEKFTRTTITSDNAPTALPDIELGYIPEGYINDGNKSNTGGVYYNSISYKELYIEITAIISEGNMSFYTDNERLKYYTISIGNETAIWSVENDKNILLVNKDGINISIRGNASLYELIKIYENIKFL